MIDLNRIGIELDIALQNKVMLCKYNVMSSSMIYFI